MKKIIVFLPALLILACRTSDDRKDAYQLSEKCQTLVDSMVDDKSADPIHNAVLFVECPGFTWKGAAGRADGKTQPMTADHPFKIASITKTLTAAVILELMEEGLLDLNDRVDRFLDDPVVRPDSLHMYKGVSYGRKITIGQLLSHTSGIKDYMEDPRFVSDVLQNPQKQYDPAGILGLYYRYQTNRDAVFPPGTGFDYSDMNYVLLALVIERVTGTTYADALRERIFNRLGMKHSYLEYREAPRSEKPLSHAFLGTVDLVDDVNTSFDWGGGGVVSTCEDLSVFFRTLLDGKLFRRKSTLKRMLAEADKGRGGDDYDYGLGIMKRTINGLTFYGHGGAYDCDVFYCPAKKIMVCMSLNQMNTHGKRDQLLLEAIDLVL